MTAQGSPLSRFTRAVKGGNVFLAEVAARDVGLLPLRDAVGLLALYARGDSRKFERAAVRWLGRLALEKPRLTLEEAQLAVAALATMNKQPEASARILTELTR
jgi:hypothetical protein